MEYVRAHIRGVIYIASAVLALAVYGWISSTYSGTLERIRLEEWYAFVAVAYLFAAILVSPLYAAFPTLGGKSVYGRARRAIGISTFCFAFLHVVISFFGLLQGFHGISFLSSGYLVSLFLACIALFILFLMFLTSNDYSVTLLGKWWKRLHRFVYLAAALILTHILTIGAHFISLDGIVPTLFLAVVGVFLILELLRADSYLAVRMGYIPRRNVAFIFGGILIVVGYLLITGNGSLSEHAHHLNQLSH